LVKEGETFYRIVGEENP
ncbi:cell division protein FtsB, partial [Vibrio parahaemolyticus]